MPRLIPRTRYLFGERLRSLLSVRFGCAGLFSICAFVLYCRNAQADSLFDVAPQPLQGWTFADELRPEAGTLAGRMLPGPDVTQSSPIIAEIDGDPSDGKEVAVGGADGSLYVLKSDGSVLWRRTLPSTSCTKASERNKLLSSPAVGDLFGDGIPYVVVGYGGVGVGNCAGGVSAFRGKDGRLLWDFNTRTFALKEKFRASNHGVFSSPALADTDGDGKMEVGFASFDHNVYLLNANGTVRWYYAAADTVWSSPMFADLDNDGRKEMIIGTDITKNPGLRPPTKDGGFVYAFRTQPLAGKRKKFQFRDSKAFLWQQYFNQTIFSSPVVADVDPRSPGPEIIVGSGCFFPEGSKEKNGKWFKVLRARDGVTLQTLAISACSPSSVAVADLLGDGSKVIVGTVSGSKSLGGDGRSKVMAWRGGSSEPLWTTSPLQNNRSPDLFGGHFISPVVADLDGNGSLEVIVPNGARIFVFEGATGRQLTCSDDLCTDGALLIDARRRLNNSVAVGDLDGDGILDLVAAGGDAELFGFNGVVYAWTGFKDILKSPPGSGVPFAAPWPKFRGNG